MPQDEAVSAVRRFNQFYTGRIGVLRDAYLESAFSLTEARVIFEVGSSEAVRAKDLSTLLGLDTGYLSRLLRGLTDRGFVVKQRSEKDARDQILRLTQRGEDAFSALDIRSSELVGQMLRSVPVSRQDELLFAMRRIEGLLGSSKQGFVLRDPLPGELGWVVWIHGRLYAEEYGWGEAFERLVAEVVGKYATRNDTERERGWIADVGGSPVGCAFVMREDDTTAKLRLLVVDPTARGMGIGRELVDACILFARKKGYRRMTLWTQSILVSARNIYQAAGFRLDHLESHLSLSDGSVGEIWTMDL
ncbi:MAG TPA: helix-turn-helix domain-containing GNAT family N-acetyltransferase [Fimbriimonas sp.]|nr:helix-turn-helix domain-containing GNAT family N-acetyltransferase [Fimbriimonas sp.]